MSRDEVVEHLGTIAKSGTREFFSALTGDQAKDAHLIGQFGVGFYSSFIVADKVTVVSRRAGVEANQAVRWESDGEGEFTVEMVEKATRGTDVTLHLREGEDEFLGGWKLQSIIRKYSDHIILPIVMKKEEWKDGEQVMTDEDETVNQASALWARAKSEITDEQYKEFYKHVAHDFEDPLAWTPCPRRRQAGIHPAALHPGARARSTCGTATPATASSSTSAASSSWTTPSS